MSADGDPEGRGDAPASGAEPGAGGDPGGRGEPAGTARDETRPEEPGAAPGTGDEWQAYGPPWYGPPWWHRRRAGRMPGRFARRPPWWPADEPWPPRDWRRSRPHRMVWRAGCLLLALVVLASIAGGIGLWVAALALGVVSAPAGALAGALAALLVSALVVGAMGRSVRRMAGQLVSIVQAAERVEEGDYSVRLDEPRAREFRSVARAFNAMAARLEANEDRRRAFLAELAHELRTPVAVVRGQLEALRDGVYPPDAEHLDPALAQARTLERLVEDVRTLGLAEAGGIPLAREPVEPAVLVNETLAGFRRRAEEAGVTLRAELPADLPSVEIDPARIGSVLSNLLSNALDHTPRGGSVVASARVEGAALAVEVRDTGSGIPPELLAHVFDRFVKGPGSTGSGLGLAIARDVVAAHGGTIAAANLPGGGAAIRFAVPIGPR